MTVDLAKTSGDKRFLPEGNISQAKRTRTNLDYNEYQSSNDEGEDEKFRRIVGYEGSENDYKRSDDSESSSEELSDEQDTPSKKKLPKNVIPAYDGLTLNI